MYFFHDVIKVELFSKPHGTHDTCNDILWKKMNEGI